MHSTSQKFWGTGLHNPDLSWSWLQFWHHLVAIFLADLNTDGDHFGSYGWLGSFKTVGLIPGISQLVAASFVARPRKIHLGEICGNSASTSSLDGTESCLRGRTHYPAEEALIVQGRKLRSWWIFQAQERIDGQSLRAKDRSERHFKWGKIREVLERSRV